MRIDVTAVMFLSKFPAQLRVDKCVAFGKIVNYNLQKIIRRNRHAAVLRYLY